MSDPTSARWALIVTVGYSASVLVGFFCGVVGLGPAYLPLCIICLAIMLVWWRTRRDVKRALSAGLPHCSPSRIGGRRHLLAWSVRSVRWAFSRQRR